jgi:hypothetical protein
MNVTLLLEDLSLENNKHPSEKQKVEEEETNGSCNAVEWSYGTGRRYNDTRNIDRQKAKNKLEYSYC